MTNEELKQIEKRAKRAQKTIGDLCLGEIQWIMSVPVSRQDPDIILAESIADLYQLIEFIRNSTNTTTVCPKCGHEAPKVLVCEHCGHQWSSLSKH